MNYKRPFKVRDQACAVEMDDEFDLVFLTIGLHEYPMSRDDAQLLAQNLAAAAAENVTPIESRKSSPQNGHKQVFESRKLA